MKIDDQLLLEFRLEMEQIISEREGMIAENMNHKLANRRAVPYGIDHFYEIASRLKEIKDRLVKLSER